MSASMSLTHSSRIRWSPHCSVTHARGGLPTPQGCVWYITKQNVIEVFFLLYLTSRIFNCVLEMTYMSIVSHWCNYFADHRTTKKPWVTVLPHKRSVISSIFRLKPLFIFFWPRNLGQGSCSFSRGWGPLVVISLITFFICTLGKLFVRGKRGRERRWWRNDSLAAVTVYFLLSADIPRSCVTTNYYFVFINKKR